MAGKASIEHVSGIKMQPALTSLTRGALMQKLDLSTWLQTLSSRLPSRIDLQRRTATSAKQAGRANPTCTTSHLKFSSSRHSESHGFLSTGQVPAQGARIPKKMAGHFGRGKTTQSGSPIIVQPATPGMPVVLPHPRSCQTGPGPIQLAPLTSPKHDTTNTCSLLLSIQFL